MGKLSFRSRKMAQANSKPGVFAQLVLAHARGCKRLPQARGSDGAGTWGHPPTGAQLERSEVCGVGEQHWSGGWVEAKIGEPFRNGNQMSRSKGSKFSTAPSFVASV